MKPSEELRKCLGNVEHMAVKDIISIICNLYEHIERLHEELEVIWEVVDKIDDQVQGVED